MSTEKKETGLFLGICFGVWWVAYVIAYINGVRYGDNISNYLLLGMSLLPAAAVFLLTVIGKGRPSAESAGLYPHFKGNIKRYIFAYLFPPIFTVLAAALFFVTHPASYDPQANALISAIANNPQEEARAQAALFSQVLLSVLAGPLINFLTVAAEEIGFRGFLLPRLRRLFGEKGALKAAIVSSAIWSLWYVPLYFDKYHYGAEYSGFPFLGMLIGFLFYFLFGIILSYFAMKTGSVFPGVLMRSGVMAMAAVPVYFSQGETSLVLGPSTFGLFGCCAMLLFALVYFLRIRRMEQEGALSVQ